MLHFPKTAENFLRYGLSFLLEGWKQEGLQFITWIYNLLCNSVLTGLLGDLAANAEQISHGPIILTFRSSRLEVFCRKGVLRSFAKFPGNHQCQSLFFKTID